VSLASLNALQVTPDDERIDQTYWNNLFGSLQDEH